MKAAAVRLLGAGFDEIIPLRRGTKVPAVQGWSQRGAATVAEAQQWDDRNANVGMLARNFPAIDIDVDDAQLTGRIALLARERLGNAPARVRAARALLVYRTQNPFKKIKLSFSRDGVAYAVEVLGDGQQYLVAGETEKGPYHWAPEPLWDTLGPDDLTWIGREDVEAFLVELQDMLIEEGWDISAASSGAEREHLPDQASLQAPSMDTLREVLSQIPNDESWDDRDEWLKMIAAIRGAGGPENEMEARNLAAEWSAGWTSGAGDPELHANAVAAFDSFTGGVALGWSWILDQAQAHGHTEHITDAFPMAPEPPQDAAPPPPPGNPFAIEGIVTFSDVWKVRMIFPAVKDKLRFASGVWYMWDGSRWVHDLRGQHRLLVEDALGRIAIPVRDYAATLTDQRMAEKTRTVAKGLQGKTSIENTISLLQPRLAMNRDDFDQQLMWLGTPEGVVELATGALRDAKPADLISRSTAVTPRAGPAPRFQAFLAHLTGGDAELATFLQRYAGYALTGQMGEKVFLYGFGASPDTGKSTFIHILQELMGEYARAVDIKTFTDSQKRDTGYTLAQLPGVRLVTATEPERGQTWKESTIKAITGGDALEVRAIYGFPFSFQPQFKLLIAGNSEPHLRVADAAMLRRVLIVPMDQKVSPEEVIKDLGDKIIAEEGPAVLQWMVEGAADWNREGLELPQRVKDATKAYSDAEDIVAEWIDTQCTLGVPGLTPSLELFTSWSQWCRARNIDPGSARSFTQELKARGYTYGRNNSFRGFEGISVRPRVTIGTEVEV